MKFAVLALLGAVSAYSIKDLQSLPEWRVDHSAQCQTLLAKEGGDIGPALNAMPHDRLHQLALMKVAKFFQSVDNLCHETPTGFYCPDAAQGQILQSQQEAQQALLDCHSPQATRVAKEIGEFFAALDQCSTLVGSVKTLIKVQLPPAGQQALQKEVQEFQFESRKFEQSPYAREVSKNFQAWAQSPEAQRLGKTLEDFKHSSQGHDLDREIDEAIRELDGATHEIPNGFEIDNSRLNDIERELLDVETQAKRLEHSAIG
mmetsp:Transcript_211/g.375  ORF Transcript_211/g.375 Transcript_211/m.375 type:complete len:260 (+) Transcript_211:33-812(+)